MENIQNQNVKVKVKPAFGSKIINNSESKKEVIEKADIKSTLKKTTSKKSVVDESSIEEPKKVLTEEELIAEKVKANILKEKIKQATKNELNKDKVSIEDLDPFLNDEEKIISYKVRANLLKEKVKEATKKELDKINAGKTPASTLPPKANKSVDKPTVESVYLKRLNSDGTLYINDYRRDTNHIYKWNGGHWEVQNPDNIKSDITNWLETNNDESLTSKHIMSIYNVFYYSLKLLGKFDELKEIYIPTKTHWLVMDKTNPEAGFVAITPDRDIPITYQINVFVNDAGPYITKKFDDKTMLHYFLNSSLPGIDKQSLVQEYLGYTLTTDTKAHKFQYWLGDGGNGKGVMVAVLSAINNNRVATRMEEIGLYNDNFIGKSLIFASETSKTGFDTEFLKAAVSGDEVSIRGIRKEKQSVKLIAKWIMLGNNEFRVDDFSNGLFRRMIIVKWNNTFDKATTQIKDLAEQIIDNELDLFLDWCIDGLQRLLINKYVFTTCEESEKALFNFKHNADKIRMFTNDCPYEYVEDKSKYTTKEDIYNRFILYAANNGYEKMNTTNFWLRMKNIYPQIDKEINDDVRKGGKRIVYLTRTIEVDDSEVEEAFNK